MIVLHTTHQVSQKPTEVDRTQECDAHNGTESNLTQDHPHLFVFRLFLLFHNLFILGVSFVAVGGLEPPTSAILRRFANLASRHTVPLSCAADFLRHYVQQCGVSSRHRREGVSAHPVNLILCSPFLDIGAACPPPTLTTLHSIIATIVASVCSGWNHRPAVSLVCPTCQRTIFSFHCLWKVQDSNLRCPRFQMSPCGGLLFFAFVLSANLPIYICFGISFSFR